MKILLFSDNHRNSEYVESIIREHKDCDRYISLGDSEMSESELSALNIFGVKGNYPFEPRFPEDLLFDFDGWVCFFTHGHKYGVKNGLSKLYESAKSQNVDIVCFGHTHRAYLEEIDDIIFLNPGSLTYPKGFSNETYAIMMTSFDYVNIEILDYHSGKVIQKYQRKKG